MKKIELSKTSVVFACLLFGLSCAGLALSAEQAAAEEEATGNQKSANSEGILPIPDYEGDIWSRSYLTGDWGGKRTEWTNKGVQTEMEYLGWTGSVIDGGNDSSTETGNNLSYKLKLDLIRAGFLPRALRCTARMRGGQR